MIDKIRLPEKLSADADALLEQTSVDEELNRKIIKLIDDTLGAQQSRSHWRFLLSALEPQLQLKLLYGLVNNRRPNQKDWKRIFQPLKYNFSTGWHYRTILTFAGIASLIALVQMFYPVVTGSRNFIDWFVVGLYPIVLYFWIALRKGINESWEPSFFLSFGLFAPITFWVELFRLFRDRIVWAGVQVLFDIIASDSAVAGCDQNLM